MQVLEAELDYIAMLDKLEPGVPVLKGCTRCKGDIYYQKDHFGPYFACLQAEHTVEVDTPRGRGLTLLAYTQQMSRRKFAHI